MSQSVTPHSVLEKFEFYFLGLTFTMLAASIQTANFGDYGQVATLAEVLGWALLAASGLVGLAKIEHIPVLLQLTNQKGELKDAVDELAKHRSAGYPEPIIAQTAERMDFGAIIERLNGRIENLDTQLGRVGWRHEIRHHIQRWGFAIGLFLVAFARAFSGIVGSVVS
ncbi:MAG: hypothetical protein EVA65_16995 [Oceanococcus sp.]|nr:MAG: hypothetical protein EVA65_16995 [Oceanococcus sp.]